MKAIKIKALSKRNSKTSGVVDMSLGIEEGVIFGHLDSIGTRMAP